MPKFNDLVLFLNRVGKPSIGSVRNAKVRKGMKFLQLDVLGRISGTKIDIEEFIPVTVYVTKAFADQYLNQEVEPLDGDQPEEF